MTDRFDFLGYCRPGMTLTTGDRRTATIRAIDRDAGLVHGEVPMHGPCSWRADGIWSEAPCGANGPLDLQPPAGQPADAAEPGQRRASVVDALRGPNRHFCCD